MPRGRLGVRCAYAHALELTHPGACLILAVPCTASAQSHPHGHACAVMSAHSHVCAQSRPHTHGRPCTQVKQFAQLHSVHVWFVAHPKQLAGWKGEPPNLYDISGSAHFVNKADNGLVVHRDFHTAFEEPKSSQSHSLDTPQGRLSQLLEQPTCCRIIIRKVRDHLPELMLAAQIPSHYTAAAAAQLARSCAALPFSEPTGVTHGDFTLLQCVSAPCRSRLPRPVPNECPFSALITVTRTRADSSLVLLAHPPVTGTARECACAHAWARRSSRETLLRWHAVCTQATR